MRVETVPTSRELEHDLGIQMLTLYRQSVFGKVAKAEIDLKVFATMVRLVLREDTSLWDGDRFRWLRVEPTHLRRLSVELRTTETRIASFVEQCALAEGAENLEGPAAIAEIQRLVERYRQDRADLKEGRVRLFIPNRYTKRAIEAFLSSNGAIPETSFHRDHLVIRVGDLLLAAATFREADTAAFLKEVARQASDKANQGDMQAFEQALNARSPLDQAMQLGKALLTQVVDQSTGAAVATLLGIIVSALTS